MFDEWSLQARGVEVSEPQAGPTLSNKTVHGQKGKGQGPGFGDHLSKRTPVVRLAHPKQVK